MKCANPYLRYINKRYITEYVDYVMAYDFRIFYVKDGEMQIETENNEYIISKKSLILIPPATAYRIRDCKKDTYIYILNFDLDSSHSELAPMPPDLTKSFDYKKAIISKSDEFQSVHTETDSFWVEEYLELLIEESLSENIYCDEMKSAYMKILLINLKREKIKESLPKIIIETKKYIEENCLENLTNRNISEHFGYHPLYLNRIFNKHTGKTIHIYALECKLKEADRMLASTEKSIYEIAELTGFNTSEYFSKVYKKYYNQSPSQARKKYRMM